MIIRVKRRDGKNEAPEVQTRLCRTESLCVMRGKRELDDPGRAGYWKVKAYNFKLPHRNADVRPGKGVHITCRKLWPYARVMRVKSYKISGTPNGIWATMTAERFLAPP